MTMKYVLPYLLILAVAQAANWTNDNIRYKKPVPFTQKSVTNGRVIGGTEANIHQFPYQVGLFLDGTGFCGASLISDTIVLTAAHCVYGTSYFDSHFAAHNIWDNFEDDRQIMRSTDGVIHSLYNTLTVNNDIAFVRLQDPISGPGISTIRLPSYSMASNSFAGDTVRVSGWGWTSDVETGMNSFLLWVDLSIISNVECVRVYGDIINDSKICVSTNNGAVGVCFGDSGGPLTIGEEDGELTQIGITSFVSSDGCEAGYPAGFTRVTSYLKWIEDNTGVTIRP